MVVAVLVVGFALHRGFYTRKVRHAEETIQREAETGRGSRVAGLLALPALVTTLLYVIVPRWTFWSALPLPTWARWLGVAIAAGGTILLAAHRELESLVLDKETLLFKDMVALKYIEEMDMSGLLPEEKRALQKVKAEIRILRENYARRLSEALAEFTAGMSGILAPPKGNRKTGK